MALMLACQVANSGTEIGPQTIKQISTGWGAEGVYVWTNENIIEEGCQSGVARLDPDHPLKTEIVSIMLSAFHSGARVKLYVDGCAGSQMRLKAVGILK